jgi:hypothetical protein
VGGSHGPEPGPAGETAPRSIDAPVRTFATNAEGTDYGLRTWAGVGDRLTFPQREALLDWGGSGHMGINGSLRSGWPPRSEEIDGLIRNIDDALRISPTPEPVSVVRVTTPRAFDVPMEAVVGTVQRDRGYLAAALGPDPTHGDIEALAVVEHFDVPAGTPAIFMNHVADHLRERELLLARDLPRVIDDARLVDGVWHVHGRILSPEEAAGPGGPAGLATQER